MKLVIDPSTLVSGGDPHGTTPPSLLFDHLTEAQFELIVCPRLLAEVGRALRKPYFRQRVNDAQAAAIVGGIADAGTEFPNPTDIEPVLRDPEDDYLVALARGAGADAIVSSDKDLLEHPGLEPPAITARRACELLGLAEPTETP